MSNDLKVPTHELVRELPRWASVVKRINDVDIYNMSILDNVISWTKQIPDVPAIDYYGHVITYGQLPDKVREYVNGLESIGISNDDVITLCMPVSVENNLALYAVNNMGRIQNSPNFLFLRNDFKTYTEMKGSKTLIILDAYLPFVIDYLEPCGIKNVVITDLNDYLPEDQKDRFVNLTNLPPKLKEIFCDYEKQRDCIKKMGKMRNVNFIKMQEVIEVGRKDQTPLNSGPVDIERDVSYSYTSGTTGAPKCIVFKEQSANALIELHKGVNTKDYVGERCFQVIPLTHATGERFCGYLQMARGKTMVPQPLYNKDTFGKDLAESKCNWITAAPSFYTAGIAQGFIGKDAFKEVTRPSSGGEPVTKSNVALIDEWLAMNGCTVRFSIGGGAGEDGSSTICSYFMDDETKTNETGHPVEPGIKARIVDKYGNELPEETRGFLQVSSAAAADRYLNNPEATAKRWFVDENGIRWGVTGDIAIKHHDGSYNILGRADDSYIDEFGETKYLFDIEYSLETVDPVIEWEITAHRDCLGKYHIVGQVVPKPEFIGREDEIVEILCNKYHLEGIKIYEKFESSEVTGKRDFQKLKADKEYYYAPCNAEYLYSITYAGDLPKKLIIPKKSIVGDAIKSAIKK